MICSMLVSPGMGFVEKRCVSESLSHLAESGGKEGRIFLCLSKMIWLRNFGKFSLLKEAKIHCGLK